MIYLYYHKKHESIIFSQDKKINAREFIIAEPS